MLSLCACTCTFLILPLLFCLSFLVASGFVALPELAEESPYMNYGLQVCVISLAYMKE